MSTKVLEGSAKVPKRDGWGRTAFILAVAGDAILPADGATILLPACYMRGKRSDLYCPKMTRMMEKSTYYK